MSRLERNAPGLKTAALGLVLLIAAGLSLAGLIRVNTGFAIQNPGGSDFLVAWEGMRSVMLGESPYSDETAARIQERFYGRPALPGENQLRVPYPIYSLLFLSPLNLTDDYSLARGIWMTFMELASIVFALVSLHMAGTSWARWQMVVFLLFALLWYFGLRAIINGNVIVLVALFLALTLLCLEKKWDWAAGALLACSTFKPQVAVFPIILCLLWGLRERRWKIIIAFLGCMTLMVTAGWVLSPTWIRDNWREVVRYAGYDAPGNPESSLRPILGTAGSWMGIIVSITAMIFLGLQWMRLFRSGDPRLRDVFLLTLVLTPLSGMQTDAGNQFVLLLPLACVMPPPGTGASGSARRFAGILAAVGIGLWALFLLTIQHTDQPVQHPVMLFPLPVFLAGMWIWDRLRSRAPHVEQAG
jgi:hypothetical protein